MVENYAVRIHPRVGKHKATVGNLHKTSRDPRVFPLQRLSLQTSVCDEVLDVGLRLVEDHKLAEAFHSLARLHNEGMVTQGRRHATNLAEFAPVRFANSDDKEGSLAMVLPSLVQTDIPMAARTTKQ